MKAVFKILSILCIAFIAACSDEVVIDPVQEALNPTDGFSEWSLEMKLPDEPKTRAAAQGTAGADGLYSFSREVNKLWYALYYNDNYIYDCTSTGAPTVEKIGDKFSMTMKVSNNWDPSKVKLFFWAGNADDNVTLSDATSASNGININFTQRCVSVDPKYLNGNGSIAEYDSFCGYFQLSPTANVTNYEPKFSLKRPFAQIHILSDQYKRDTYSGGIQVIPGFGRNAASSSNMSSDLVVPTTWFFDESKSLSPTYKQGEYIFAQSNYEFTNDLGNSWPSKTTFNGRDFHYLGCLLTFAPDGDGVLKGSGASGNTSVYGKLNLAIRANGQSVSTSSFTSVNMPSASVKANNRYVVYNKYVPPAYLEILSIEPATVGEGGGEVTIKIRSTDSPSCSSLASWMSRVSEDRTGDVTTLKIKVDANASVNNRSHTLTFSYGSLSANATINQSGATPYIQVISTEPSTVLNNGGNVVITIESSSAPTYTINSNWYSKVSETRTGDTTTLTLNVTENTGTDERKAEIYFTNGGLTDIAEFKQRGNNNQIDYIDILSINPSKVTASGGDVVIKVQSNKQPTYDGNDGWLTIEGNPVNGGDIYTYTFTAAANTSASRSTTITFHNGSLSTNATVNQADGIPADYLSIESFSPTAVESAGGDVVISVKSNNEPTYVIADSSWVSFKSKNNTGDIYNYTFTASENSSSSRSVKITFKNNTLSAETDINQKAYVDPLGDYIEWNFDINTNSTWTSGTSGTYEYN